MTLKPKQCPKCESDVAELVDAEESDDFEHNSVCGNCIVKHSRSVTNSKQTVEEDHEQWRQSQDHVRNGSGWPR